MNLETLINKLEKLPLDMVFSPGFGRGRSWRGSYEEIAFEHVQSSTVAEMLAHAKAALGTTLHGYKGGEYHCDESTECNVADWGCYGGDSDRMDVWWATNSIVPPLRERIKLLESLLQSIALRCTQQEDIHPLFPWILSSISNALPEAQQWCEQRADAGQGGGK